MRDDDDNLLADHDLSAWEAPPPSAALADKVIARAKQPPAVAAVDAEPKPSSKRWWIAGGVIAALAAAVGFVMFGIQRAPKNGSGDVTAAHAQPLELGPSSARLDQGTEVHWRRERHTIAIEQPKGAATWTISGDDTARIDAGAMVASVEASGASLRVEVQMNLSDARAIGASAVTAAVVAMVTVIVYEGRVKVTHGGQTVNVEPGATLELRGTVRPPDPVVGLQQQLDEKDRQIRELQALLEQQQVAGPAPTAAKTTCDFDALVDKGNDQFGIGLHAAALVSWEQANACKSDQSVIRKIVMAACNAKNAPKAKEYYAKVTPSFRSNVMQICVRNGIDLDPGCDADALRQKGEDHLQTSMDAAALAAFEASLACKSDAKVMRLAMMAACRSKNDVKARLYNANLPASQTTGIVQICVRNGIALDSQGTLQLQSKPAARIAIDGVDTGKTTPAVIQLAPGKHKVTYTVGYDKFTWAVTIKAGETTSMMKDLQ